MPPQHRFATAAAQSVVDDAALDWFVRLRADRVDASERARFQAWLDDDEHRRAFGRVVRLWRRLAIVRDIARASPSKR